MLSRIHYTHLRKRRRAVKRILIHLFLIFISHFTSDPDPGVKVPKERIILWGHSLGSGIAVQLASSHSGSDSLRPAVIVLESSFTSMYDAVYSFPFSALHKFLPFFDHVARVAGSHPDTRITNDDKIGGVRSAILILHAQDDRFLSVEKARLLHRSALRGEPEPLRTGLNWGPEPLRIRYVEFAASLGYGHMALNKDSRIPTIFNDFLRDVSSPLNGSVNSQGHLLLT